MRWFALPLAGLVLACGSTGSAAPCSAALPPDAIAKGPCLTESLHTERDTYAPGQPLTVTVTAVNMTSSPCAGARELACGGPALAVQDAGGNVVFTRQPAVRACPMLIRLLQPGETQQMTLILDLPTLAAGAYSVAAAPGRSEELGRHYFRIC